LETFWVPQLPLQVGFWQIGAVQAVQLPPPLPQWRTLLT
jgi:hypothetical protein